MTRKQPERIPIDTTHPEQFFGQEFYLAVARENLFLNWV